MRYYSQIQCFSLEIVFNDDMQKSCSKIAFHALISLIEGLTSIRSATGTFGNAIYSR